jgi:erythrin-vacuolar iron transport family protein
VGFELFLISWVRYRFLHVPLRNSMIVVTGAGAVVVAIGVLIGAS